MGAERRVNRASRDEVDTRPGARVANRAAAQWGMLSVAELHACGLSKDAISRRVSEGWLHPFHRGVYAVGHPNPPLEGCFLAAVKACGPDAVLSHYAAAAHLGIVSWDGRHPEVTVVGAGTRIHRGIGVHRTLRLDARDVTRHRGIPITSPARTLVDLASVVREKQLRRAVRQAQSLKLVTVPQLVEALHRLGPRRGATKLAKLIADGPAPTRSELEDVVLELILSGGLARPDINVSLTIDGRVVVPDFRWPAQHLVVEADSAAWHDHKLAREDDAERQAFLEAHGERVVRVAWAQAIARRGQTLTRIRGAGAPAAGRASS